jgi:DNA-binding transcriptional ArsR family regulator
MEPNAIVRSLAALAQETRLAVYRLLVQQGPSGMAAGEIAAQLDLAPATLSFHLKELAHAGLVRARQSGRFIFYAADFDAMNALLAFLTENCCAADCGPACEPAQACTPPTRSGARAARPTPRTAKTRAVRPKGVKP